MPPENAPRQEQRSTRFSSVLPQMHGGGKTSRSIAVFLLCAAAVASIASIDRYSRVRSAYRRAERLERLARRPADRDRVLEAAFLSAVDALDRRRPSPAQREAEVEILRKRWEQNRIRSAWAEAYHAWRDVYGLYAPPEGRWTRRARFLAPAARQRWREDWTERGLPFQEGLLDAVPGEEDGFRWLATFPDPREMSQVRGVLTQLEIPSHSAGDAVLLVPEARFWEAHQALMPLVGLDENW